MRVRLILVASALALLPAVAAPQDLVISDVSIVDAERDEVRAEMSVLVSGGRIVALDAADRITVPEGFQRVDGRGKYLIPGLWDMHVHSSSDRISREILYPLYIANGVTGIRNMKGGCAEPCGALETTALQTLARRTDVEEGRLVGPRIITAGPIIYGAEPGQASTIDAPRTREDGIALARLHAEIGVDLIKVYDQIPADAFRGLAEEGRRLGLPIVGHVPWELGAAEAARAGMRSFEHLMGIIDDCSATADRQRPEVIAAFEAGDDEAVERNLFVSLQRFSVERCDSLYSRLATYDVWQVPTLVVDALPIDEWWEHPGMRYLPRPELEYWLTDLAGLATALPGGLTSLPLIRRRVELITMDMYRAGVPILAGSDALTPGAFPGFSLHEELERLVKAGLSPAEALGAATLEPARFLEATDSMGSIAEGRVADLVLLDANPLDDIRRTRAISSVIARGVVYTRDELDAMLERAADAAGRDGSWRD